MPSEIRCGTGTRPSWSWWCSSQTGCKDVKTSKGRNTVFGRKPKTKHFKELLEIRGDPGKFNVSRIKGEENFKKEMVDLQHLLLWRSKGEWRPGAFLKWVVTTCSHTLLMGMLNYRMQFKNRAPYLIKCIVKLWNFKEMLKLHKHVKLPFF